MINSRQTTANRLYGSPHVTTIVHALHPYIGQSDKEITVQSGQPIGIHSIIDDKWAVGEIMLQLPSLPSIKNICFSPPVLIPLHICSQLKGPLVSVPKESLNQSQTSKMLPKYNTIINSTPPNSDASHSSNPAISPPHRYNSPLGLTQALKEREALSKRNSLLLQENRSLVKRCTQLESENSISKIKIANLQAANKDMQKRFEYHSRSKSSISTQIGILNSQLDTTRKQLKKSQMENNHILTLCANIVSAMTDPFVVKKQLPQLASLVGLENPPNYTIPASLSYSEEEILQLIHSYEKLKKRYLEIKKQLSVSNSSKT